MKRIFLDIETLPVKEELWREVQPELREDFVSRSKKSDPIGQNREEAHRRTALSGEFGRILCIGLVREGPAGEEARVIGWDERGKRFHEDEAEILRELWNFLRDFDVTRDLLIGHNILDFDLRFIYQRSVVQRVKPSVELSFRRYSSSPIFDTMQEWAKWSRQEMISLDRLALVLGLPTSKSAEISGDKVFDRFRAGKHQLIRDYCMADVELTRKVYRRLSFAE